MHHSGVEFSVARAVPRPGIELDPILGVDRYRGRDSGSLGLMIAFTAACVAAGLALAGHPQDIARTFAYATLIGAGGSALAIRRQRRAAEWALAEERQRIARNLHDGLAQELAYIRMETQRMAAARGDGRAARLAVAAERALEESRGAIEKLRSCKDGAFSVELSELADELTTREGARLIVDVDPDVEVESADREALLRIMREAISNGVRHGRATEVALELTRGEGIRMAVRDNGAGFKPGGARRRGSFGLASMRQRARALGGDLTVQSAPGEGTLVEVTLP